MVAADAIPAMAPATRRVFLNCIFLKDSECGLVLEKSSRCDKSKERIRTAHVVFKGKNRAWADSPYARLLVCVFFSILSNMF